MHDTASDGLYLINLNNQEQKQYVAWRSFFYQMGPFFIKGGLLTLVGFIALHYPINAWSVLFLSLFGISALFTGYHWIKLPEIEFAKSHDKENYLHIFKKILGSSQLYPALLFIFFYNFSDAQMQKIIPLFLLAKNGLHLNLAQVGELYGVFGSLFLMAGIFTAGLCLSRYSLSACIKCFTILLGISQFFFLLLTIYEPNSYVLYGTVLFNQFTLGLANAAYMGYLLLVANKSEYPMTLYTLCTSLMALGYVVFGAFSGWVEQHLGYGHFFFYLFVANGFIVLLTYRMMSRDV